MLRNADLGARGNEQAVRGRSFRAPFRLTKFLTLEPNGNNYFKNSVVIAISVTTEVVKIPENFLAVSIKNLLELLHLLQDRNFILFPLTVVKKSVSGLKNIVFH